MHLTKGDAFMKRHTYLLVLFSFFMLPELAFAHGAIGSGFLAGLSHPVGGLDHLLAMLSVGVLSTQMGRNFIWTVPATFVSIMLLGGYVGLLGIEIPMTLIEHSIVLSVILLGLVIATGGTLTALLVYLFVAFFGFSHGYAHGVEMPIQAKPLYFATGFIISTLIIHIVGIFVGLLYAKGEKRGKLLLQYTGAVIMGMGLQMLLERYLG
jgi:urease accessory protein